MKQPSKADLQDRLARAERLNGVYFELFRSIRNNENEHVFDFDADGDGSSTLRVFVRGTHRVCGGIATVTALDTEYTDTPEYLTDLISRWLHCSNPYLRDAARKLLQFQADEVTKPAPESEAT